MLHAYDHVTDDLPIKAQWSETSLSFCGKCCGNLEDFAVFSWEMLWQPRGKSTPSRLRQVRGSVGISKSRANGVGELTAFVTPRLTLF